MGYPMAGHLSKNKELELFVYNRTKSITTKWLNHHKGFAFQFDELFKIKFDGLIVCLKDDASIINVLVNQKLIRYLKHNTFILDHSTTSLQLINLINSDKHIIKNNISFYDAPVSGGEVGAINGVLSIMIGGPNNKIPFLKKIMSAYSKSIVHIGPSGHGQLTKMVNQLCIAGLIQALSEGISLGQSAGLNMNKVLEAISNGAAQSWQMDNRFKTMIKEEFDFGFAVSLMIKDLKIALNEAQDKNLDLQISKIILQNYKKLLELGDGTLDTSSLIKLIKT